MNYLCRHCEVKGNITKCKTVDCFQCESWYAIEQQKEIDILKKMMLDYVQRKTNKRVMISYFHDKM